MKHGRTLAMAIEQLADPAAGAAEPGPNRLPNEPLGPLRPGAFAAWAARQDAPSSGRRPLAPRAPRPRLVSRPPAV